MDSCMCAYSTVQQLLCHGSFCELILSLARTSCRLWFTARPSARPLAGNPLRDAVRSRNPSKSTLAHDAVTTAVLHKHHPIIRTGAGLIQFVLRLATEATRNRKAFSPFSARVFKKPTRPSVRNGSTLQDSPEQGQRLARFPQGDNSRRGGQLGTPQLAIYPFKPPIRQVPQGSPRGSRAMGQALQTQPTPTGRLAKSV